MSTRRPSFPQYVADWLGNSAVRLLPPEFRGILADLKCLANDGEPYGTLTHANGKELTDEEIARVTSTELDLLRRGISALLGGRILGRLQGSGKLAVLDMVHREEVRQRRAAGGVKSIEHPNVQKPKQQDFFDTLEGYPSREPITEKKRDVVSTSDPLSLGNGEGKSHEKGSRHEYPPDFESAWVDYPKRAGTNSKADAFKQWQARLADEPSDDDRSKLERIMSDGVRRYAIFCVATKKIGTELVMQADRFFGRGMHYLTPYEIPPDTTKPPAAAQMFANSEEALRNL
jgi:hypothetical protein